MSNSNEGRWNGGLWSLPEAASWIQSSPRLAPHVSSVETSVKELHNALKIGEITGSGCVDGGERRTILPEEWHDYSLQIRFVKFPGVSLIGSKGTLTISVLSVRSVAAAALKYHSYPSGIRIPSPYAAEGEVGYHRVITDVLLPRRQIMERWPHDHDDEQVRRGDRGGRRRPGRERAEVAINNIYPSGIPDQAKEPNSALCGKIGQWLKEKKLPNVSDDTILRAAGRRK